MKKVGMRLDVEIRGEEESDSGRENQRMKSRCTNMRILGSRELGKG